MAFFDFLQRNPVVPANPIYAVPIATRRLADAGNDTAKTYIYYAFLFAQSPESAVARLQGAVEHEGHELLQVTGPVMTTSLSEWTAFVSQKFDWMRDALPTAHQLEHQPQSMVYYSPKIIQS